jgi:NADH:flavin oxidoreductase / NADH oxidase family
VSDSSWSRRGVGVRVNPRIKSEDGHDDEGPRRSRKKARPTGIAISAKSSTEKVRREEIDGWRRITRDVHAAGGRILLQLWHVGRISDPSYHDGALFARSRGLYRLSKTRRGRRVALPGILSRPKLVQQRRSRRFHPVSTAKSHRWHGHKKAPQKSPETIWFQGLDLVAGAGFEPAAFRL